MEKYKAGMKRAEQLVAAIDKKLGDTKGFARMIESPEFTYIELGFREKGKSALQEVQVAYAADYFEGMDTKELMQDRGKRVLADVLVSMGRE